MAFQAQIIKINKLGDNDPTYGQRYWGEVSDDLTPISFNSRDANIELVDDEPINIEYEEKTMKKSAKGTTYWQLKKVRVLGTATPEPQETVIAANNRPTDPSTTQLDRLETSLQELHSKIDKLLFGDEELHA